jgi:hypothetical protein
VELKSRILSGLLIPAFLLAVWLCPCAKADKPAQSTSHKCCESGKTSPEKEKQHNQCPHCNGGPSVTAEQNKIAGFKIQFHNLLPVLVYDPLYLVQCASATVEDPTDLHSLSPPIRLQTCTFLF